MVLLDPCASASHQLSQLFHIFFRHRKAVFIILGQIILEDRFAAIVSLLISAVPLEIMLYPEQLFRFHLKLLPDLGYNDAIFLKLTHIKLMLLQSRVSMLFFEV